MTKRNTINILLIIVIVSIDRKRFFFFRQKQCRTVWQSFRSNMFPHVHAVSKLSCWETFYPRGKFSDNPSKIPLGYNLLSRCRPSAMLAIGDSSGRLGNSQRSNEYNSSIDSIYLFPLLLVSWNIFTRALVSRTTKNKVTQLEGSLFFRRIRKN